MGSVSANSDEANLMRCDYKKGDEAALAVTITNTNVTIDHCCLLTGLAPIQVLTPPEIHTPFGDGGGSKVVCQQVDWRYIFCRNCDAARVRVVDGSLDNTEWKLTMAKIAFTGLRFHRIERLIVSSKLGTWLLLPVGVPPQEEDTTVLTDGTGLTSSPSGIQRCALTTMAYSVPPGGKMNVGICEYKVEWIALKRWSSEVRTARGHQ
ncbi:hypothetical protein EGR_04911 [Echinococcus granulosus]|uniref:Uncharacterized protein n=1 Tax=Echinococcus granulosus TaxID=6210 RepID=W6UGT3_ECHGR|nr:hypothetical protein EGR_04911 [Echinococcus granulosus]EUB60201.1 hypothetical protein EGR_04911 [Echinococcus granulosus]